MWFIRVGTIIYIERGYSKIGMKLGNDPQSLVDVHVYILPHTTLQCHGVMDARYYSIPVYVPVTFEQIITLKTGLISEYFKDTISSPIFKQSEH